ncbi:hypothetical protein DdX_05437 [Ditylenchus destructor]|uniref:Uncharacterized protein n=1 Tax=Ditylenchus destructor TaxID=166010 RepID=A0AAD4N9P3_9BILA|nr:hypothetical protein DdX_05437 [Ditylenchus destructor]
MPFTCVKLVTTLYGFHYKLTGRQMQNGGGPINEELLRPLLHLQLRKYRFGTRHPSFSVALDGGQSPLVLTTRPFFMTQCGWPSPHPRAFYCPAKKEHHQGR